MTNNKPITLEELFLPHFREKFNSDASFNKFDRTKNGLEIELGERQFDLNHEEIELNLLEIINKLKNPTEEKDSEKKQSKEDIFAAKVLEVFLKEKVDYHNFKDRPNIISNFIYQRKKKIIAKYAVHIKEVYSEEELEKLVAYAVQILIKQK